MLKCVARWEACAPADEPGGASDDESPSSSGLLPFVITAVVLLGLAGAAVGAARMAHRQTIELAASCPPDMIGGYVDEQSGGWDTTYEQQGTPVGALERGSSGGHRDSGGGVASYTRPPEGQRLLD